MDSNGMIWTKQMCEDNLIDKKKKKKKIKDKK